MTQNNEPEFPMRINKYLAYKKYATRRGADKLITEGLVTINGKPAELGDRVNENDLVQVDDIAPQQNVYLAYYKPRGIVTMGAQQGERAITDVLNFDMPVFPLGRLDKDSEGLIIVTNDGRITESLLAPESGHEKEYSVTIDRPLTHAMLSQLKSGVRIDVGRKRYKTKPAKVRRTSKMSFDIVLTEGKNRQIRKMTGAVGAKVTNLKRIRIMNIELKNLKSGQYRILKGRELKNFLEELGY
jgi:23S rRNA pseudouridine2604 synthase